MTELSEDIIKDLEPYFSNKWSLLEICTLESAKISGKIEKATAQNNVNAFRWILSMIHVRHTAWKEEPIRGCQDVICKSILEYTKEEL